MNACVLKTWWILLCALAATALASPYGRFMDNYKDDQDSRRLFREDAFVLNKRDRPTPNSVARLAKMHSTVGIGKRDVQDAFLNEMSKLGGEEVRNTASPGQSTEVNVVNIDKFANGVSQLFEVFRTCPHALQYVINSDGTWETNKLKDLLNTCLNVAALARRMTNLS
ncbi:uncharacterized protein LOC110987610 [Acanthaster planci]|uniref:Uncharacterized protein LOC110987610 n=1 Tax=Acanthaster planci TaxID=133434 RepID=A0A8B7ZL09_ACAPL|nr:uncharacterized protein LOC110987610 [Acanthaster planci]